jgi:FAD/FMN-containing dehydrogenase
MIGGMVGNNSCGAHSLVYGYTRDHTLEVEMMLSDGSIATFGALSDHELEGSTVLRIQKAGFTEVAVILSNPHNQKVIRDEYPDPAIHRRNTGYALDLCSCSIPSHWRAFIQSFPVIAGSEGTLGFIVSVRLNLVPLPPKETALVCVHFDTLEGVFSG